MSDLPSKASDARQEQAVRLEQIAREAETLAGHARLAATHFRNGEVPRAGAHILAVEGHLVKIRRALDEIALVYAERSRVVP